MQLDRNKNYEIWKLFIETGAQSNALSSKFDLTIAQCVCRSGVINVENGDHKTVSTDSAPEETDRHVTEMRLLLKHAFKSHITIESDRRNHVLSNRCTQQHASVMLYVLLHFFLNFFFFFNPTDSKSVPFSLCKCVCDSCKLCRYLFFFSFSSISYSYAFVYIRRHQQAARVWFHIRYKYSCCPHRHQLTRIWHNCMKRIAWYRYWLRAVQSHRQHTFTDGRQHCYTAQCTHTQFVVFVFRIWLRNRRDNLSILCSAIFRVVRRKTDSSGSTQFESDDLVFIIRYCTFMLYVVAYAMHVWRKRCIYMKYTSNLLRQRWSLHRPPNCHKSLVSHSIFFFFSVHLEYAFTQVALIAGAPHKMSGGVQNFEIRNRKSQLY